MRLDVYLQLQYPNISRAHLQRLIKEGDVHVNGKSQSKTGYSVKESDQISVQYDFDAKPVIPHIELPVLYEDDACVVINKPIGVLTHSKGSFNPEATVATWLSERKGFDFPEIDDINERRGIVHRLDRATSGVMICAKNPAALKHLQKQFQDRKAKKTYIARVEGHISPDKALVDLPIERNPKQPQRFRVGKNGKSAQTSYVTQKTIGDDSIIELKPVTGRTHQLRVHLHYLKHPIVGDTFYEGRAAERLFLHAKSLEITLPNKDRETFIAPEPPEFYTMDA